jgi:hypothetical protein
MDTPFRDGDIFVSPKGNDAWSGSCAEPAGDGVNGPFATVDAAKHVVRERKLNGLLKDAVTVWIRGGRYHLTRPVAFGPEDSGPATYKAYPGEEPVFDAGTVIEGWQEETLGGITVWVADVAGLPEDRKGFNSLYAGGKRCPRARLPKEGFFWMEDVPDVDLQTASLFEGSSRFVARKGDFGEFRNLTDVEVIVTHFWADERMPVVSFDPRTRLVTSSRQSIFVLKDSFHPKGAKYHLENVLEGLSEPGEWCYDRAAQKVYYVPRPEDGLGAAVITAGGLYQHIRVIGDPDAGRYVEGVRFDGLTFEHSDYRHTSQWATWYDPYDDPKICKARDSSDHFLEQMETTRDYASVPQGAYHLPGTVHLFGARFCAVENCRIERVGYYGVGLGEGCSGVRIVGNTITDMGAGGVIVDGSGLQGDERRRTGRNRITDNVVTGGGHEVRSACGIIVVNGHRNVIAHNDIHDMTYSGVSCGWRWDCDENAARENRIEKNHIHHLGERGGMSDMGCIYTLGVQPGTVIRGNLCHDVKESAYGGWGIYLDESSSCMIVEQNVIYGASSNCIHEHWGRQNILRNNILAFAGGAQVVLAREDRFAWGEYPRKRCHFERNIVIGDGRPMFDDHQGYLDRNDLFSAHNCYWDVSGAAPVVWLYAPPGSSEEKKLGLEELRKRGYETGSVVADPKIGDFEKGDFRLADDSPALALGFRQIDTSDVGPRAPGERD